MRFNKPALEISNDSFIKLTRVAFSAVFVISFISVLAFFSGSTSASLWSNECTLWLFVITFALLFAIWLTDGISYIVTWLICYTMSIYYYPRFVSYSVFPDLIQFVNIPNHINSLDINKMLMVIAVYICFISAALVLTSYLFIQKFGDLYLINKMSQNIQVRSAYLFIFLCIIITLENCWALGFNISTYSVLKSNYANSVVMFIKLLLNQDVLFPVVLYLLCCNENKSKSTFILYLLVIFVFVASATVAGSRIGPMRTLTYCLFFATFFVNKINLLKLALVIVSVCAITFIITPLANRIRVEHAYVPINNVIQVTPKNQSISELNKLSSIINRFGISDFSTLAISKIDHKSPLLSFEYTVKSILNYILPGLPYKEAPIQQSQLLPVLTGVVDLDYVVKPGSRYHSQPLTVWGQVYISANIWAGAILLAFISVVLVCFGFCLKVLSTKHWQAHMLIPHYYLIIVLGFWNLMALDQFISNMISLSLTFVFYAIVILYFKLVKLRPVVLSC